MNKALNKKTLSLLTKTILKSCEDQNLNVKKLIKIVRSVRSRFRVVKDVKLIINGLGHRFFRLGNYYAALECYKYSFLHESPYSPDRPVYAQNYIQSLIYSLPKAKLYQDVNVKFKKEKKILLLALECIIYFKNYGIYKEGYYNLISLGEDIKWSSEDVLSHLLSLQESEKNGYALEDILRDLK